MTIRIFFTQSEIFHKINEKLDKTDEEDISRRGTANSQCTKAALSKFPRNKLQYLSGTRRACLKICQSFVDSFSF